MNEHERAVFLEAVRKRRLADQSEAERQADREVFRRILGDGAPTGHERGVSALPDILAAFDCFQAEPGTPGCMSCGSFDHQADACDGSGPRWEDDE